MPDTNPVLDFIRANIGKETVTSPSPVGNLLRGTLVSAEEGHLVATYKVRPEMTNPVGQLHGGMSATIIDDLIGMTVFSLNNEYFYTSIDLHVNFLRSAAAGDEVKATAQVVRRGRNVIYVEANIANAEGKLIATATSNMARTPMPTGKMGQ